MTEREKLEKVHQLRMKAHGTTQAFPADDKEFRAAAHGSPHDTAVHMARWHLRLAQAIKDAGLLE